MEVKADEVLAPKAANGQGKLSKKQANPIDYVKNHNQFKYVY